MTVLVLGREIHFDVCPKGESWDLTVLIQEAVPDDRDRPQIRNRIVPYAVRFGWLKPLTQERNITHFMFGRLMITIYGKVTK